MADSTRTDHPSHRPWRRRLLWITVAVVGALAIILGALALLANVMRTTTSETRTVSADQVRILDVAVGAGDIEILVEDREDIAITTRRTSSLWADASSDVTQTSQGLEVTGECSGAWFGAACSVDQVIAVPADGIESFQLTARAGEIEVAGAAADITADVDAGEIRLVDFSGSTGRLQVDAGQVSVDAVAPPQALAILVNAGAVDLVLPDVPYDVSADVGVGDADVQVQDDPDAERQVTVTLRAGDLNIVNRSSDA